MRTLLTSFKILLVVLLLLILGLAWMWGATALYLSGPKSYWLNSRLHFWPVFACGLYLYTVIVARQLILPGDFCSSALLVADPDAEQ